MAGPLLLAAPLLASIGLRGFLISIVGGLIFRGLAAVGFGYLTFVGVGNLINSTKSHVQGLFSQIPTEVVQIMGLAKFDVALNIMFAAMTARLVLVGMDRVTGRMSKMSLKSR